ncbi:ligase-associated DNA damage response endonuclease PdeM [Pontibacter sp. G13]|uniref:ligase-associated DNA damage response endonuclease PdeM n=1 Tax=Pontibacter sp. G13 TaxID=3074898 RepID=UPI00288A6027|nr:ligase-associated DNA damage response endonuclease PdeM [Pontibacter sp. G13]WNJ19954.1 ligase-associated DNA damage response endonuclease PdeM [Pontibacter sp. G13]
MNHSLNLLGQHLILSPQKAAYWQEESMLLIADVHFGKISHFRKHGHALPQEAMWENVRLLDELMHRFEPQTVCFLGDLFHSDYNSEWKLFAQWCGRQMAQMVLIEGNHDIMHPDVYAKIGMEVRDAWEIGPFRLTHHPEETVDHLNLCGHIHPAVRLTGLGRQALTLPCFFLSKRQMVMPAFGTFTGLHLMQPAEGDRAFVVADGQIAEIVA